jgi:hypothetical protein
MTNGKNYIYSIYAKAGTNRNYLSVRIYDYSISGHYQFFIFDLGDGQTLKNGDKRDDYYGGIHEIQDVGNDWYRCIVSFPVVNDSANGFLISNYVLDTPAPSTTAVADDGGFIYVWGAQLEQRDVVTAYTPTNGAPVTKYQPQLMFASPDQPRFDHDVLTGESKGLLIEESRTNLIEYSEDISGARWSNAANFETNVVVAPDGELSGDRIYQNDAIGYQSRNVGFDIVSGVEYVYSVYAKDDNLGYIRINIAGISEIDYDLTNGTFDKLGNTSSIVSDFSGDMQHVGGGWYRCIHKFTSAHTGYITARNVAINANGSVQGDGRSGFYIWGAQLEVGSFPTSYIKTSGASATRSADNASITGENFSSWYRQDEGSLYSEAVSYGDYVHRVLNFSDGTSNNRIVTTLFSDEQLLVKNNNNTEISIDSGSYAFGQLLKQGTAYKDDSFFVTLDGNQGSGVDKNSSSSNGLVPKRISQLNIGCSEISKFYINGHIKKLSYYPQRLTNEQLQQLTK